MARAQAFQSNTLKCEIRKRASRLIERCLTDLPQKKRKIISKTTFVLSESIIPYSMATLSRVFPLSKSTKLTLTIRWKELKIFLPIGAKTKQRLSTVGKMLTTEYRQTKFTYPKENVSSLCKSSILLLFTSLDTLRDTHQDLTVIFKIFLERPIMRLKNYEQKLLLCSSSKTLKFKWTKNISETIVLIYPLGKKELRTTPMLFSRLSLMPKRLQSS